MRVFDPRQRSNLDKQTLLDCALVIPVKRHQLLTAKASESEKSEWESYWECVPPEGEANLLEWWQGMAFSMPNLAQRALRMLRL